MLWTICDKNHIFVYKEKIEHKIAPKSLFLKALGSRKLDHSSYGLICQSKNKHWKAKWVWTHLPYLIKPNIEHGPNKAQK